MENFDIQDLERATSDINPNFAGKKIGDVISALVPYVFAAAGVLLLLFLVYGGISLMLSGGDPKAAQAAKAKITGAVIGFVIVFAAYWIVQLVGQVLGIEMFGSIFQ